MPIPSADDRHILSRFSFGVSPSLVAESLAAGGARRWFSDQLEPADIPDGEAWGLLDWWPTIGDSFKDKLADDASGRLMGIEQDLCLARWTLIHRMVTRRQVLAVMSDFWSNLLHVPAPAGKTYPWRPDYERVVRSKSLTSFTELLTAAVLHPAMLVYLDNANSTATAPNENLGRELLELHTVGREADYTEAEVRDSMRILTGYRVDETTDGIPYYSPEDHATGQVRVLGFDHPNTDRDGRAVAKAYLTHLATHHATATRIAERLVRRFVADDPPPTMVRDVATAFVESNTDIKTTLRAMVDHPAFRSSAELKVRTPSEDLVNTYRVLQADISPPTKDPLCAANVVVYLSASMGQRPYDWPRPDGFPETSDTWSSASRMLGSWRIHRNTSAGIFPKDGVKYRDADFWVPQLPARLDAVVERMSRMLLAKELSDQMLATACKAIDEDPATVVDVDSPIYMYRLPLLLVALLDTPDHMGR